MNDKQYIEQLKIALYCARKNFKSTGSHNWKLEIYELEALLNALN